jgi:hypothetical protein
MQSGKNEEIPPNMPASRGRSVTIYAFVYTNHAGNVITRRSPSGIFLFVQNAPTIWHSKRQNALEAATFFGSGLSHVALRNARVDANGKVQRDVIRWYKRRQLYYSRETAAEAGISRVDKDERLVRNDIKLSSRVGRDER